MAGVQSVDRAIDVLDIMTDLGGEAGLSELAERTGLPLPTIHRLLQTLVARGYARQAPSRRYALGPRVIRLADAAGRQLGAGARPVLERVARELGETVNLALLDQGMVVYVGQALSSHSMRMFTEVGRRFHSHSTGVGKAMLSTLPDEKIREIVGRTGLPAATMRTITDVTALIDEAHAIRDRGYAIDDGEQEIGVRCFAVLVPGMPTPAAISVSGPDSRVTFEFGERALPVLRHAAAEVGAQLRG